MNRYFKKLYSGFVLKLIATLLMVIGQTFVLLDSENEGVLFKIGYPMFFIGLPIACFLAIEGYKHTRSVQKYIYKLILIGALAELIIDFSSYGTDWSKYYTGNGLNVLLTIVLGLIMIVMLEKVKGRLANKLVLRNVLVILLILLFIVIAIFLGFKHNCITILIMSAMYLFYGNPFFILIATAAIQIVILGIADYSIMFAPIIGVIITWFYNGERGYKSIASQAFFYGIYPIVYSIVAMVIKAGLQ